MEYTIDLVQYGIVAGSFGKPPYTNAQYLIAKNNGIGFSNALAYANANGYDEVSIPKNTYSFTYEKPATSGGLANREGGYFLTKSNLSIDLNKSTFEVIFDSVNKSPYDLSADPAWKLYHNLIWVEDCEDVKIFNGYLRGDIFNRSFIDSGEAAIEQTYGVRIGSNCRRIKIDLDIQGFMGDAIAGSNDRTGDAISPALPDALPGLYNDNGTVTDSPGAYVTASVTLNLDLLSARMPVNKYTVQLKRIGGSLRTPQIKDGLHELIFLTDADALIKRAFYRYLDYIVLPYNCKKIRMQLYNEDVGQTSITQGTFGLFFTVPASSDIEVCGNLHNNHRGGISNMPDRTTTKTAIFRHNGDDCSIGAPLFPSTTRYQVDYENMYSDDVKFYDNTFIDAFNGIITASELVTAKHNKLTNSGGFVVYRAAHVLIESNTILNGGNALVIGALSAEIGGVRIVIFKNNTVINTTEAFSIADQVSTEVNILDNKNVVTSKLTLSGSSNTFSGNNIELRKYTSTINRSYISGLKDFSNNYIKQTTGVGGTELRFFLFDVPNGHNNTFENLFIFRSGYTFGDVKSFLIKGCKFINCTFQTPTNYTTEETHEYVDCIFDNTTLTAPVTSLSGAKPKLILTRCKFIIYDKIVISVADVDFTTSNRAYEITLIDPEFIYKNDTKPYLIGGPSTSVKQRRLLKISNAKVVNNPNFKSTISFNGKI